MVVDNNNNQENSEKNCYGTSFDQSYRTQRQGQKKIKNTSR